MSRAIYRLTHETHADWCILNSKLHEINEIETIDEPRTSCLEVIEPRVKLAIRRISIGDKKFIEGVPVKRLEANRGLKFEIYKAQFVLDQAVLEVVRIVTERQTET